MKIQTVANIPNSYNEPSFEGNLKFLRPANYCLKKLGDDINVDTVKELPGILKFILRKFTPKRIKEMAQLNLFMAKEVKSYFDDLYGENNYTLISIGRSVASIVETVRAMGAQTKIIPLSGLRRGLPKGIKNLEKYKKYLNSIGINKDVIDKSPEHKFILFDFSFTGSTLENAQRLFESKIFNGKKENFIVFSINQLYKKFSEKIPSSEVTKKSLASRKRNKRIALINNLKKGIFDGHDFHRLFCFDRFKIYSPVGKLNVKNLGQCFKQANPKSAKEYKSPLAACIRRLFLFNVFDKFIKNDFGYKYPKNEMDSVQKRYLSFDAKRIRFNRAVKDLSQNLSNLKS